MSNRARTVQSPVFFNMDGRILEKKEIYSILSAIFYALCKYFCVKHFLKNTYKTNVKILYNKTCC